MAAVFVLVFLFALASVGIVVSIVGTSIAGIAMATLFIAMASGVFLGLYRLAKEWEGPAH